MTSATTLTPSSCESSTAPSPWSATTCSSPDIANPRRPLRLSLRARLRPSTTPLERYCRRCTETLTRNWRNRTWSVNCWMSVCCRERTRPGCISTRSSWTIGKGSKKKYRRRILYRDTVVPATAGPLGQRPPALAGHFCNVPTTLPC